MHIYVYTFLKGLPLYYCKFLYEARHELRFSTLVGNIRSMIVKSQRVEKRVNFLISSVGIGCFHQPIV